MQNPDSSEEGGLSTRFSFEVLVEFCTALLVAAGVGEDDATVTATRLVEADFRGRNGHGLIRAAPYLDRIAAGGLDPRARMQVVHETSVSAQVDAANGLGQVAMTRAVELAADKAAEHGVAVVGTVRSNHAGAAGLYPAMLAERNLVGLYVAVANANGMPPWGGLEPILGTNPVAVAIPSASGHPYLLDIATTATSHGSIKVARQEGRALPVGWVVDATGEPITDPARAGEGFLLPMGGYKGAGLAVAVGLLAGVLNGAAFGREVVDHNVDRRTPTNTGQLLVAFRVDLFRPVEEVLADVTAHLDELRTSRTADGSPVRLAGDRAAELWHHHRREGLELPGPLRQALDDAARRLGVPPLAHHEEEKR
jgi:L-2-hydroxycarboxylate dehydrogenase (NAD+)